MKQGEKQMTRYSALRRAAAHGLCFILVFSLGSPILCAPGTEIARVEPIRIAIGPCSDDTGKPFGDLAEYAARALSLAFAQSQRYRVVSALERDSAAQLVVASLGELKVFKGPQRVSASLKASLQDARTGEALIRTDASGVARVPGKRTADASLAKAAVDLAAGLAAAQIAQAAQITGHVVSTVKRDLVELNVGRQNGVKPGTEFKIVRLGTEIGKVRARSIAERTCECTVVEVVQGERIRGGDEALVTYVPDTRETNRPRSKHTARIAGIIALLGIAATIAIGAAHEAPALGPHVTTVVNVGASKNDIKNDGIDTVTITAIVEDPAGTPVADGTAVSFAIKAGGGSGLLDGAPTSTQLTAGGLGVATTVLTTTGTVGDKIVVTATVTDVGTGHDVTRESPQITIHV